ncbi:hypothetical protein [Enhygromyxa salina]|uniref:hypothetical protein n=1 Tax=Enhygromyxa salina TaxID=215803 RepID=UPI0011BAA7C6|nr:hypothetical protein [Enhygromyxa salina]
MSLALSGCSLTPPPRSPEDERALQRARSQERKAAAAREQLQQEWQATSSELARLQAELAALDSPQEAAQQVYRAQSLAFESYENTIQAALAFARSCDDQVDLDVAAETGASLAGALAEYVSEPKRDEALKAMERCRPALVKRWRKVMNETVLELQRDFAVAIEDVFDENNPYSRGSLTAKTKGTTLNVRMRGNFEGRARHSQEQVDMWCESGSGLFTKIILQNSQGTFSCKPDEGPKELIATILEESKVNTSWVVVGVQPTPSKPEPPPPATPEVQERRVELLAAARGLESGAAQIDARASEIAQDEQQARQSIERVDLRHKARGDEWKQTKIKRASNTQIAGGVFVGIGGVVLLGTVGASQAGVAEPGDLIPIGVGVSVPLVVTGVLLLVGGGVRKKRVQEVVFR